MKFKVLCLALLVTILFCTFTVQAQGVSIIVKACEGKIIVENQTNVDIPFVTVYHARNQVIPGILYQRGSHTIFLSVGEEVSLGIDSISIRSGYSFWDCDSTYAVLYNGTQTITPVATPVPVFVPEECKLDSLEGTLYLLPGANPVLGTFALFQVAFPDSKTYYEQNLFTLVMDGSGKPDALLRCSYRQAITSHLDPLTGVTYQIAGWYKGFIGGREIFTVGLLAGQTRQLVIYRYDSSAISIDPYSHNVILR